MCLYGLYVFVFVCIRMFWLTSYMRICTLLSPPPRSAYVHVCVCILFSRVCPQYLYVLYVLAQTSTNASTTSPKGPPPGWHLAGPTQGTPGQAPNHFFPPSGTQPQTRFGAPGRVARVGGVQSASPAPPTGSPHTFRARQSRPNPHLR